MAVTNEQLLAVVDDLLRTAPASVSAEWLKTDGPAWFGRAAATITRWDSARRFEVDEATNDTRNQFDPYGVGKGLGKLVGLLHQARFDLQMDVGSLGVVVPQGGVFDYFDHVRKIIEGAQGEVFFVDPYLNAEFVSRFMPHIKPAVKVRLLGGAKTASLLAAVATYARQTPLTISVRSSDAIHDRLVFVDRLACYVSGASFKDGAKNAPVVVMQIADAFSSIWATYAALWDTSHVEM
jgi:hypothetical protein